MIPRYIEYSIAFLPSSYLFKDLWNGGRVNFFHAVCF